MQDFRRTLAHHLSACERELQQHGDAAACPVVVETALHKLSRGVKRSSESFRIVTQFLTLTHKHTVPIRIS